MNMFTKEDILAQLAAGKKIEQIAQEAADALNLAKAEYDRMQWEKQEAERKARETAALQKAKKEKHAASIMDGLFGYLTEFHPGFFTTEEIADFRNHFSAADLSEAIDETVKAIKSLPEIAQQITDAGDKKNFSIKAELSPESAKQAEDAITSFLKKNGLF